MHADAPLRTERLELIPATPRLARADAADRGLFSRLLGAAVPEGWPPELLADHLEEFAQKLEANPFFSGLSPWYVVKDEGDATERVLTGSAGFFDLGAGDPSQRGVAMIGYALLPAFQGRGLATEAVLRLVEWAFSQGAVERIIGDTFAHLQPSIRVLEKCGFVARGAGGEPGAIRFERRRMPDAARG